MSCGMITFTELGLADQIERYVAYEYDVKSVGKKGAGEFGFPALVASHNFPNIEQRGIFLKQTLQNLKGLITYWQVSLALNFLSLRRKIEKQSLIVAKVGICLKRLGKPFR